jgi:hypothetical protein
VHVWRAGAGADERTSVAADVGTRFLGREVLGFQGLPEMTHSPCIEPAARGPRVRGGFLKAARGSLVRSAATGATWNNLGAVVFNVADEGAMPRITFTSRMTTRHSTKQMALISWTWRLLGAKPLAPAAR